ncbi:hypothetical protein [Arenibaculum sp.]|jgi:hypothetical protein|uniref:hypothetical protein n=1 Tax=Arenibaculum sp. TaxID=2865862 RepID=UPI002E12B51D|nr:hypothetical protein [Arenibaculum sp.]
MTVRLDDGLVRLEGSCTVEEAEALLETILANPELPVDWSRCTSLHTAVLQVLMATRPVLQGLPEDPFLRRWVEPVLTDGREA